MDVEQDNGSILGKRKRDPNVTLREIFTLNIFSKYKISEENCYSTNSTVVIQRRPLTQLKFEKGAQVDVRLPNTQGGSNFLFVQKSRQKKQITKQANICSFFKCCSTKFVSFLQTAH